MYEQFFGLNRPPFKITPDTSLFYDGGRRGDVLGALVYAVQRGEGIVKVVGEVGSGKTMLCRMLQQELPGSVEIIYIANPSVSADDILFVIAHELKLDVQKDSSKHEVMHLLQAHLLNRFTGNRQVVLFVEEAQGMPLETLEEIRLLSNLETDQDKLLQIILFGQPELDENLKTTSIRQLKERITHEFNLTPLTDDEIHQYLNFRMREVGYTGPELINGKIAKIIGKYSGGLLRRINIIGDKVLLSAFAESTHNVSIKHVNAAVKDSGFERSVNGKLASDNKSFIIMLALIVILLLGLLLSGKMNTLLDFVSSDTVPKEQLVAVLNGEKKIEKRVLLEKKEKVELNNRESIVEEETISNALKIQTSDWPVVDSKPALNIKSTKTIEDKTEVAAAIEDRLTAIIIRKKKNSGDNTVVKKEESHKKQKKVQNSLSKWKENTKIIGVIVDNKEKGVILSSLNNAEWLNWKLKQSKNWLKLQPSKGVSIQVMMRSKEAANELAIVLRNHWPLDVSNTHLYEVQVNGNKIYRIFFGGYRSLSSGRNKLKELPEEIRLNQPYLYSIYKMKKTLL